MPLNPDLVVTIGGVDAYDESAGERLSRRDAQARRIIVCAWTDRIAVAEALLGTSSGSGITETIGEPEGYPDAPWLKADEIDIEGFGTMSVGANDLVAYEYARLTVTYRAAIHRLGGFGGTGLQIDLGSEVLTVPQDEPTFKWVSDDVELTPEASPNLSIPCATLYFPQPALPNFRESHPGFLALIDSVNDRTLFSIEAGHLLYKGMVSLGRITADGIEAKDLVHKVLWRQIPWNYFFRPSSGEWEAIVKIGNGAPLFPEADLNALLGGLGPTDIQPGIINS